MLRDLSELERLFAEAVELSGRERSAFLEEVRSRDASLSLQLAGLLAAHEGEACALDAPASLEGVELDTPSSADLSDRLIGRLVAGYRVISHLGSGGMSQVFAAEQLAPRRIVALKILTAPDGFGSRERFEAESEVLALLDHPNIARVHGAGRESLEGEAHELRWIAVELVPGAMPVTRYAEDRGLDLAERVRLFLPLCEAVHHAHRKGVLHRDLKPANLLVPADGGAPKVIDFGLARLSEPMLEGEDPLTRRGELLGTPHYMSPEQCVGDPEGIDVRSDVYSLGVVLYELLTRTLPYDVRDASLLQVVETVRATSPRDPSRFDPRLSGDLSLILQQALRKDPNERYDSATALAADLERWLERRPIQARSGSGVIYRVVLFARRRTAMFAALAVAAGLLVAGTVTIGVLFWKAETALQEVRDARASSRDQERELAEARRGLGELQARLEEMRPGVSAGVEVRVTEALVSAAREATRDAESSSERRQAVAESVERLDALAKVLAEDWSSRAALARAYHTVGSLHGFEWRAAPADVEGSLSAYLRAVDLWRRVAAERPDDDDASRGLLRSLTAVTHAFRKVRRHAEGRGHADEMVGLARRRVGERRDTERIEDLVKALWARGDLHIALKPHDQGERDSFEALALMEEIREFAPMNDERRGLMAWTLLRTGLWTTRLGGDKTLALDHHVRATNLRLQMCEASCGPDDIRLALDLFVQNEAPLRAELEPASMRERVVQMATFGERQIDSVELAIAGAVPLSIVFARWMGLVDADQVAGLRARAVRVWGRIPEDRRAAELTQLRSYAQWLLPGDAFAADLVSAIESSF